MAMEPERWRRVKGIFDRLLDADPQERPKLLEQVCGDDPELRQELQQLLAADAKSWSLLDAPADECLSTLFAKLERELAEPVPERIGPCRPVRELGHGGMGVVYLAEQQEPLRRQVAVKVIKAGMDSKEVVARFETERQTLALMDHPNIARVFDAGTSEDGRPYFVMEYVPGVPMTDYCDRQRLATVERLRLFQQVCAGIQHAHQKGIIHRDLKPSNVLVASQDGKPWPKVIDFGVAKALNQPLTEKTLFTRLGAPMGTPEYMSPEQADPGEIDVDTRADIYSLGVLLYELLTGMLPFEPERFRKASYSEIQRILREEEPPKPSLRIGTMGARATEVSQRRRADVRSLAGQLKGDLDWIALKALEKDPARRYQTAHEFEADIERHLQHQPVMAGPPTAGYRVGKFVRRHRGLVAAAVAFVAMILAGAMVSTALYLREQAARQEATEQARRAEASKLLALGRVHLDENPTLALAYTIASLERADEPAARRFVMEVLWRGPIAMYLRDGAASGRLGGGGCAGTQFSQDGHTLAVGYQNGRIETWPEDGSEPRVLKGYEGVASRLRFGPGSDQLAVERRFWSLPSGRGAASPKGLIVTVLPQHLITSTIVSTRRTQEGDLAKVLFEAWPLAGGEPIQVALLDGVDASDIARRGGRTATDVASDGSYIAFGKGRDLFVVPLAGMSSGPPRKLGSHSDRIVELAALPGALATGDALGEIRIWSPGGGEGQPRHVLQAELGYKFDFSIDRAASRVASHSAGGTVQVWDLDAPPDARPLVLRAGTGSQFNGISLHPGGQWVATSTYYGGTQIWPLGQHYPRVLRLPNQMPIAAFFSRDGKWLAASASLPGRGSVWRCPLSPGTRERSQFILEKPYPITPGVSDPTGRYFLVGSDTLGEVWLIPWTGGQPHKLEGLGARTADGVAFSPDGHLAAAAQYTGGTSQSLIRVWDLESGQTWVVNPGNRISATGLCLMSDGTLISSSYDGVRLMRPGMAPRQLLDGQFNDLACSPDGRLLLAPRGHEVLVMDRQDGSSHALPTLSAYPQVDEVAFDPSGTIAVSGGHDGVVRVAPIAGGEAHLLVGHQAAVLSVDVSPDGQWIASASEDNTIRLWPMPHGQPFHTLPYRELLEHLKSLTNLRLVPDARTEDGYRCEVEHFPGWKTVPTW